MFTFKEAFFVPALVLALAVGRMGAAPAEAAQQVPETTPLCDPDSIDGTFTFASLPAGEQIVSLHFQNKSNSACRLHGQIVPSFAVDGHSMNVASCWLCEQNDTPPPSAERSPGNQILLAPGERARLDLRWASTGEFCQWADDANFSISEWAKPTGYLFVPSNWPMHICSTVKSSGYRAEENSPSIAEVKDGLLRVSVTPAVIYSDENAMLHAELADQTNAVTYSAGCAMLYTVRHGPAIGTRFEPIATTGFFSRPSYTPEQVREDKERAWPSWKTDRLRKCDIAGGQATADAHISAADLANLTHLEWHRVPGPGEDTVFLTAATHFTVLDVETLAPNWGDPVEGIRAGISVDRMNFSLGERIPLHLRWENVNAAMPLAQGECKEPEPALEIHDSQHNVVRTIPITPMCMGHGWGAVTIEKGKPQRDFIELLATANPKAPSLSVFPGPGVYFLVSVWSPRVLEAPGAVHTRHSGRFGEVYATARSLPVRIEVAPGKNQ